MADVISQRFSVEGAHIEKLQAECLAFNDGADDGVGAKKPVRHLYADLPYTTHLQSFSGQKQHAGMTDLMDFPGDATVAGNESDRQPLLEEIPVEEAVLYGFLGLVGGLFWRQRSTPEFPFSTLPLRTIIRQLRSWAKLTSPCVGGALLDRPRTIPSNCTKMGQKGRGGALSDRPVSYPVNVKGG